MRETRAGPPPRSPSFLTLRLPHPTPPHPTPTILTTAPFVEIQVALLFFATEILIFSSYLVTYGRSSLGK